MFQFNNSYSKLPENFYERIEPSKVNSPRLIKFNTKLAEELKVEDWSKAAEYLSGNKIPEGASPIAQAYAGHQFGNFVPQLGDGRAILLGEVIDINGERKDIQLKGSGQTRFSRNGDGRAALGPVIREYLVSEAMHALGIPTTRSLAIVSTGEVIYREEPLAGAVLTRVASSHVRIGTFEYFTDIDSLKILADYIIDRHYPEASSYIELLDQVSKRQAELIAKWVSIGFVHGVMNTDNMSICGETIDYGPCAFMDYYDPATVFSSIDRYRRYAYSNQASIGAWNISKLAESLLPLIDRDEKKAVAMANEVINNFMELFINSFRTKLTNKIGLEKYQEKDGELIQELLDLMHKGKADFNLSFRYLNESDKFISLFDEQEGLKEWLSKWHKRLEQEDKSIEEIKAAMSKVNPGNIPRNHKVEEVIEAAYQGDFSIFETVLEKLSNPYDEGDYLMPEPEKKPAVYDLLWHLIALLLSLARSSANICGW